MKINNSFNSSVLFLPLNKLPSTGTLLNPGVLVRVSFMIFFLIPPITTISPSLTKSLVIISFVEIPKTKYGKLVELAVKQSVEGEKIKNLEALANPDSLKQFKNIKELNE